MPKTFSFCPAPARTGSLLSCRFRLLVAALSGLALFAGLLDPAQAQPAPTTPMVQAGGATATILNSAQWSAAKLIAKARKDAMNDSGTKMNYRKMKTIFGTTNATRVDWRRQMASAFRQYGGTIVYISKAENAAVEKRRKQIYGSKKPKGPTTAGRAMAKPVPCRGANKYVRGRGWTDHYMDSCQSKNIQDGLAACIGSMTVGVGVAVGLTGLKEAGYPAGLAGVFCGFQKFWIDRAIDGSTIRAIIVRTWKQEAYMPYPSQVRYSIRYETRSQ